MLEGLIPKAATMKSRGSLAWFNRTFNRGLRANEARRAAYVSRRKTSLPAAVCGHRRGDGPCCFQARQ